VRSSDDRHRGGDDLGLLEAKDAAMLSLPTSLRVFAKTGPTDMRKSVGIETFSILWFLICLLAVSWTTASKRSVLPSYPRVVSSAQR
jgi:hypothetical protein